MAIQIVVKHPFATYQVGDHITDPALVALYSASHPAYVVRKAHQEADASPKHMTASQASPTVPKLASIP